MPEMIKPRTKVLWRCRHCFAEYESVFRRGRLDVLDMVSRVTEEHYCGGRVFKNNCPFTPATETIGIAEAVSVTALPFQPGEES